MVTNIRPFTLLSLGIGLAIVMAAANRIKPGFLDPVAVGRLVVLGVAVGSLRLINAWDFPTYLIIAGAAILLAEFLVHGGFGLVIDGSEASDRAIRAMIAWDVNNGVARRAWAGNPGSRFAVEQAMHDESRLSIGLPHAASDRVLDEVLGS